MRMANEYINTNRNGIKTFFLGGREDSAMDRSGQTLFLLHAK